MDNNAFTDYDLPRLMNVIAKEIDGVYIIDADADSYVAVKNNAMFNELFGGSGSYLELSRALMFHFSDSEKSIVKEYHVFLPALNKFNGKYSRRIKLFYRSRPIIVQMTIYPLDEAGKYALLLTEMDSCDYLQDFFTAEKENSITSSYLFTMHVDLKMDICNSVSVAEMSDDTMNYSGLRYSDWRMMIVNMIYPEDRAVFLQYTDPEYLRSNLKESRSTSVDCQMQNLSGEFIWVKLIFNKIETADPSDFRFVFMVQDIHESSVKLIADIKRYEELSSIDSLTGIFNRGKIENELYRCIQQRGKTNAPLSLMMLDLDFFKNVNDTYGHAVGDTVLKEMVTVAAEQLKPYNITFGRWGGEEFIGVCALSQEELRPIAEELREAIKAKEFTSAGRITCSIGIIEVSPQESSADAFRRVDKALYKAKNTGRNCVVCGG